MGNVKWALMAVLVWCGVAGAITPSPYWKNEVEFPEDPFRADGLSFDPESPGFIKFTILDSEGGDGLFPGLPELLVSL